MLKRKQLLILFLVVPILLLALIAVQWYWMKDTYRLRTTSFNEQVNRAVQKTVTTLDNQLFSWNLYSKAYLNAGQGVLMFRHKQGISGLSDTLTMYNAFPYPNRPDSCFYKTNMSYFDRPTLVDINVRIETLDNQDLEEVPFRNQILNNLSAENYRKLLDDPARFTRQLSGIDTVLKQALREEGLDTSCSFAVTRNNNEPVLVSDTSAELLILLQSPFQATLFTNRPFIQPYHLYVRIANKDALIMKSMRVLIFLSVVLVLALCGVFTYFFAIVFRQKKLSEMKTDFINNMTHEFMTPVTNIGLAIETLERTRPDEQSSRHIMNMIVYENSHLRENINKVLQVATMDRGTYDTHAVPIDLNELLRTVVKSFELTILQAKGTVTLNLLAENPIIHADETHVINLFSNILDNSIKYKVADRQLILNVACENTASGIKISIKDNGKGMDSKVQKHAFTKFYRGTNGNTHDVKGFGLGLNYVKTIAETYGWEIELKSITGKGTTFNIWIK